MNSEHSKVAVVTGAGPWIEVIAQVTKFLVFEAARHINGSGFTPAGTWMIKWT